MDIGTAIITGSSIFGGLISVSIGIARAMDNRRKLHPECKQVHKDFKRHVEDQSRKDTDKIKQMTSFQSQMENFQGQIQGVENHIERVEGQVQAQDRKIEDIKQAVLELAVQQGKTGIQLENLSDTIGRIANKLDCSH